MLHLQLESALEYSVKETPLSDHVHAFPGIEIVFGKYTRKVLRVTFEYNNLDLLIEQMSGAAKALRGQKRFVPQDSIKKNYQLTADVLLFVKNRVKEDLEEIKGGLKAAAADVPIHI